MNTKLNMDVIEDKSITYSKLADDVAESIIATMPGSTPDWNADEGETGYIKNRTHFFEWYAKPEDENFNDLLLGLKDKTPISVTEDGYIKTVKYLANECCPMWERDFEYFDKFWESNSYNILDGFVDIPDIFAGGAEPKISISNEEDDDYNESIYVTIQWNTEDTTDDVNEVIDETCFRCYIIPYHNYNIHTLNGKYIPDFFIKTTPQTLSNNAKNQALTNLGIKDKLDKLVNITYSDLKTLRDNSQLIPGQQYRITDYITTTTQSNTQSAGHQFDVIVIADDEKTLNEVARACLHEGDSYFSEAGAKLEAWQIWYSLDNDTERFAWADEENGKGVIYRMIDEYSNECPYDFKNIKFYNDERGTDVYTFTWIDDSHNVMDTTVFGNNGTLTYYSEIPGVYSNVIKPYVETIYDEDSGEFLGTKQSLNNITFISDYEWEGEGNEGFYGCRNNSFSNNCYNNSFGNNCYNNSFSNDCYNNSFSNDCYNNSFGDGCYNNSFGNNSYSNSLGNDCRSNIFGDCYYINSLGNSCNDNSFGNNCNYNSFGNNCYNNSFGDSCEKNSFGNYFYYNSFGNVCSSNSFSNNCHHNSFGNDCYYNSFGNDCSYNSFGNGCNYNSFGNDCSYNSFGNGCNYNSFGNNCNKNSFRSSASATGTLLNNCWYNHFDDGCRYNVIWNSDTTSSSVQLKNINVNRGVSGKSSAYNYINIDTLNVDYEIQVAKNSKGEIKMYCEADLTKLLSSLDSDGCLTLYHE